MPPRFPKLGNTYTVALFSLALFVLFSPFGNWQLTKLKDGLAMGCAFNHALLDGASTWHFMNIDVEPENVRSGCNNKFDGMIYLYSGKTGGRSIDVELTLEHEAMGILEQDKDFLVQV